MSETELHRAMRPGSVNPNEVRAKEDLGRFGWGLKSASFSQCRKLMVISRKNDQDNGAFWDLDKLDSWSMGILDDKEIKTNKNDLLSNRDGTEVIWSKCDRLSEDFTIDQNEFNALISKTKKQLSLVFHRFLNDEVKKRKLKMRVNHDPLKPIDPFLKKNDATQTEKADEHIINNIKFRLKYYILPHFSKSNENEYQNIEGSEGITKNQGFYIYRNDRLIQYGTWFGLVKYNEYKSLIRIAVDIPNSRDDLWKLTIDKTGTQLPSELKAYFSKFIKNITPRSVSAHRARGGNMPQNGVNVWRRTARDGIGKYSINREHPWIARLIDETDTKEAKRKVINTISLIEHNFPTVKFSDDLKSDKFTMVQTKNERDEFRDMLDQMLPLEFAEEPHPISHRKFAERIKQMEPYRDNWKSVEEWLQNKGWVEK